jgi:hypothetical protein
MATSAAEGGAPGGMGLVASCIRTTESSASFFVGSSFAVAFKSPIVTRLASADGSGGLP